MNTAIVVISILSFLICLPFLSSAVYGFSPGLKTELLNNKIENFIYYGTNDGYNNNTLADLKKNINLDRVYVTSNGTHLEIKLLFNDFLDILKNVLLNNSTLPQNFFINIYIDSDDDETTGFLGYNYAYNYKYITHNISTSYNSGVDGNNNADNDKLNIAKNFSISTQNYLNQTHDILEGKELEEIVTRTLNSKDIIEKLDWIIRGYELLDYDFQPLFFTSKLDKKYLSVIPDGLKVTIEPGQIGYPSDYSLLVEVGRKSADYKLTNVFGKVHVPRPNLILEDKTKNIFNGKNSVVLEFNNTGLYNLNVKVDKLLLRQTNKFSNDLSINFSQGNQFNLLSGKGALPVDIIVGPNYNQKNLVVPLNLSFSDIGENDFTNVGSNNSLTQEHIYNKIVYLNLNLNERNRLINFDEIPSQYIAVFLGAVFTFFIPSIIKSTKEYFQKRTANKYLKNILKEQNLSDNPDISIKNLINKLKFLKHDFIRGKITKDQYEILKENIADVIKDLVSKKTDTTTKDK